MKKDEINVEVNKEMEQGNEVEYCGEVCKNAFRTASIEFLEVTVAYADFATKQFGEAKALYFDNVEATDEKILKDLHESTGKVFQAVIHRELKSGLYKISNRDYAMFGTRLGDAREKKADKKA